MVRLDILIVGLGCLLAAEVVFPPAAAPLPYKIAPSPHVIEKPEISAASQSREHESDAAAILARPLFNQDRRPMVAKPAVSAATVATEPPPRLSGVIISRDVRRAIFEKIPNGKAIAIKEGAWIGAYRLISIETGAVVMVGPDGLHLLRLSFGPQPAIATASPVEALATVPIPPAPDPAALQRSYDTLIKLVSDGSNAIVR